MMSFSRTHRMGDVTCRLFRSSLLIAALLMIAGQVPAQFEQYGANPDGDYSFQHLYHSVKPNPWSRFCPRLTLVPRGWYGMNFSGNMTVNDGNGPWPDQALDFGYGDTTNPGMDFQEKEWMVDSRVDLQFGGPTGPTLRVGYRRLELKSVRGNPLDPLSGPPAPPSSRVLLQQGPDLVKYNLELNFYEVGLEYYTVQPGWDSEFTVLTELKMIDMDAGIVRDTHTGTLTSSAGAFKLLPTVGFTGRYNLMSNLDVVGEFKGGYYFGPGMVLDGELGGSMTFWDGWSIDCGYRWMRIDYEEFGDANLDLTMHGPYCGLTASF